MELRLGLKKCLKLHRLNSELLKTLKSMKTRQKSVNVIRHDNYILPGMM